MLRLKEQPREWVKFTAVIGLALSLILWLLWWRHGLPIPFPLAVSVIALLVLIIAAMRPQWFRGFYRNGMTLSFHVGQTLGKVLLLGLFFVLVTPTGLLLRLLGKDLLQLRCNPDDKTYWKPAKNSREFDRMF